jgi:LmbE family N-acetylglucosaminyl deacetylase
MHWIYLSPHLDDVALSCGGLVWEQAYAGDKVSIWTVCAGNAPDGELSPFAKELYMRWQTDQDATAQRRLEDFQSCQYLGASTHYFTLPDCIYRRNPNTGEFLYGTEESLNGPLQPADNHNIAWLEEEINRSIPTDVALVCPLSLGNHVDHQLTRLAMERLRYPLWYYQDYPYVLRSKKNLEHMEQEGWERHCFPISPQGLGAWQDSITAHASQISTFWMDELEMRRAVADYLEQNIGIHLWRKPGSISTLASQQI